MLKKLIEVLKFSQEEIKCLIATYQVITPCPLIIGETIEEAQKYLSKISVDKEQAFNQWWHEEGEMLCGKRNKEQVHDLFTIGYKACIDNLPSDNKIYWSKENIISLLKWMRSMEAEYGENSNAWRMKDNHHSHVPDEIVIERYENERCK